ncbi:hypothetical protein [Cupriavidus pauculus]|uniref:hypothetical protein n=1 Tax=Cupriavidus pauculus TaxID=82633 RepID=UPI001EE359F3|nr:hypothetical protein [Cupriavidus pauculus]GJG96811.1 hypothetical protein CBA19C6_20000 [Cupriavidus pauculus]
MFPTIFCRIQGPATLAFLVTLVAGNAYAQQVPSMEERLRNQLRITTTQLQQAQNELAALKAGQPSSGQSVGRASTSGAAGGGDASALRKELDAVRAQLAAERGAREQLADATRQAHLQTQGVVEKATSQIAQYRKSYDELLRMARTLDAERRNLVAEAGARQAALKRCESANTKLYSVGQDILRAYETVDVATVLAARQPFAAQSRVRYEQIAQDYGDKLYEGRFDVRADVRAGESSTAVPSETPVEGSTGAPVHASSASAAAAISPAISPANSPAVAPTDATPTAQ